MRHSRALAARLPWQQRLLPSPLYCQVSDSQRAVALGDHALFRGGLGQTACSRGLPHRPAPASTGLPKPGMSLGAKGHIPGLLLWQSLADEALSARVNAIAEVHPQFQMDRLAYKEYIEHRRINST